MSQSYPKARKRFGQNFLVDESIIDSIIEAIDPQPGEHFIEIGPGRGALTTPLLASGIRLDVIELDRDLVERLTEFYADQSNLQIHSADALDFDFSTLRDDAKPLRVIGNLPYNISSPLLFHLIQYRDDISDMCFMLQREVVQRICAEPGTKHYGRLSIMLQSQCETSQLFGVPSTAFDPIPRVESAILYMRPYARPLASGAQLDALATIVAQAFSKRRKTIANTLKSLMEKTDLLDCDIDPSQRPETISLTQYLRLAEHYLHNHTVNDKQK